MALGEVVAQLVAVRGAIQTAIGLTAGATDEVTDALSKAEDALAGASHDLASEGLNLWRRAQSGDEFTLAKLVAADEALAEYLEILSPGSGAGTKNTDIVKPTGEELVKRAQDKTRSLANKAIAKANDVEDAVKQFTQQSKAWTILRDNDLEPPTGTTAVTATPSDPVIHTPPPSQTDPAQMVMGVVTTGLMVGVALRKPIGSAVQAARKWRKK